MQSTRLVVTSRSRTTSPPSVSTASTASPTAVKSSASFFGSTAAATNARSQESGTLIAGARGRGPSRELLQEAQVVSVEEPDVVDSVLDHGHALDAEAEGEARHLLGVVHGLSQPLVDRLEDGGVDHPRAEDLEPAGPLAHPAPPPPAGRAAQVRLDRRLRVGEEGRAE